MNHTPTPWTLARPGTDRSITVTFYAPDAPFIVRACNSHDALINALELADAWMGNGQLCITPANVVQEKIQAALKLAKGE